MFSFILKKIEELLQRAWKRCSDEGRSKLHIIPEEHIICQNDITKVAVLS